MQFFVSDKWGKSEDKRQDEGLRQGDPLSCFLLVILMTVIMLDAREQYDAECNRRGMSEAQRETEKIFGFDDVEYADDSNFIQMNLPCLRIFAKFYIFEGRFYGLEANADKSALVVIRPAPAMAARLRHPDGWFFQVKDATKTLGLTYGDGFDTAKILVNDRIGQMFGLMDQYKRVWKSPVTLTKKCLYFNGAIWSRGRWSLHLLHLNKALRDSIDGAQASMLRRIAGIAHPYISRVSNATTRRRCNATRFSIQILRSQLRWIGHILRRPETDPLRLVVFEPGTDLCPRLTNTGRKRVVGRPRIDWAQTLIEIFCSFAQVSRPQMLEIAFDKQRYHSFVERLCRHTALQS